jgi:hypothetical protein
MCALNKVLGASVEKQTQTAGCKLNLFEHKVKKNVRNILVEIKTIKFRLTSRHVHILDTQQGLRKQTKSDIHR